MSALRVERTPTGVRVAAPAGFRGAAAGWGFATFFLWALTALPLVLGAMVSRAVGAPGAPPALFSGMIFAFLPFALFGIFLIMWSLGGTEEMIADAGVLVVGRRVFGIPTGSRRYDGAHVTRLRYAPHPYMRAWNPWAPLLGGAVAFDYGAMTFRFGTGISAGEAATVVEALAGALEKATAGSPDRPTVRVPAPRYRIDERPERFAVTMPYDFRLLPRPLWYLLAWVPLSAVIVSVGVAVTTRSVVPVLIGALISVVIVGALVVSQGSFIRLLEIIEVTPGDESFERRIEYWGFRSTGTRLNVGHVRRLRIELAPSGDVAKAYADMARRRSGAIALDFGEETYRFGLWTSEAEARMVVDEIVRRFPAVGA